MSFWGKDIRKFDFWLKHVNDSYNIMKFYQSMKVKFACDFNFESFPFDSHECDLDFGSPSNSYNYSLKFSPVQVNTFFQWVEIQGELNFQNRRGAKILSFIAFLYVNFKMFPNFDPPQRGVWCRIQSTQGG